MQQSEEMADEISQEMAENSEEEAYKWLLFAIIAWKHIDFSKSWSEFTEEIKSKTRFHVTHPVVDECLGAINKYPLFLPKRTVLYRAGKGRPHQLGDAIDRALPSWEKLVTIDALEKVDELFASPEAKQLKKVFRGCQKSQLWGYDEKNSGAPPAGKVRDFRANPVGISYLYTAESVETALAEIRPTLTEKISIAKLETRKKLKIADLTGQEGILPIIGSHFSAVALGDAIEYLPMQYLAERIKTSGYAGVRYNSSLCKGGINIVFFDVNSCRVISSALHVINNIQYEHAQIFPPENKFLETANAALDGDHSQIFEYIRTAKCKISHAFKKIIS